MVWIQTIRRGDEVSAVPAVDSSSGRASDTPDACRNIRRGRRRQTLDDLDRCRVMGSIVASCDGAPWTGNREPALLAERPHRRCASAFCKVHSASYLAQWGSCDYAVSAACSARVTLSDMHASVMPTSTARRLATSDDVCETSSHWMCSKQRDRRRIVLVESVLDRQEICCCVQRVSFWNSRPGGRESEVTFAEADASVRGIRYRQSRPAM